MTTLLRPLAITMGDPAGIGPEIIARILLEKPELRANLVIGDPAVMSRTLAALGGALALNVVGEPGTPLPLDAINILASSRATALPPVGIVSAEAGRMAYDAIIMAIRLAKTGKIAGIVTAPIHKEALSAAGIPYPGHTEILADHGGAARVAMMLANDDIRTVLVTIHCSLMEAIRRADFQAQMAAIRLAHQGGRALGIEKPRIAVAGLNPHAGEGGLFGTRRSASSARQSPPRARKASTPAAPGRAIRYSCRPATGGSTSSSRSITTRG